MITLPFFGGLVLGLSSSLHCAGMCGPIAANFPRGRSLILALAARIGVYVITGALAGGLLYDGVGRGFWLLRVAGALSLSWIGFSLLGFAPSLGVVDRWAAPLTRLILRVGPVGAGVAWGFLPCGLLYGALFYAALSGGALAGAASMLGFGLGVTPAVVASALGLRSLQRAVRAPYLRTLFGAGLMMIATLSLLLPSEHLLPLCLTPH